MQNTEEKLHEIFRPLKARLYEIESFNSPTLDGTVNLLLQKSIADTFAFPPEKVLPFVGSLIDQTNQLLNKLPSIYPIILNVSRISYSQNVFNSSNDDGYIKSIAQNNFKNLENELNEYLKMLTVYNKKLGNDLLLFGESAETPRLKFNLTVEDLSGLLRILKDLDIIPKEYTGRKLANHFLLNFSTVKGGGKGIDKIEKSISSPNVKTLEKLENIFTAALNRASDMKEKRL